MKTIQVLGGTTIDKACLDAAADARLEAEEISFDFNGITVVARPTSSADEMEKHAKELAAKWHSDMEAGAKAYRQTSAYRREHEKRAAEIVTLQKRHDDLMAGLPQLERGDHKAWMTWLLAYVGVVDDVSVKHDFKTVEKHMTAAGYRRDDECMPDGLDAAARRKYADELAAVPEREARWIAGQVIDGFHVGPGPHPVAMSFIKQWLGLEPRVERKDRQPAR